MPAIFNVFSNFGRMCLLDNLAEAAICGGLVADPPEILPVMHVLGAFWVRDHLKNFIQAILSSFNDPS